MAPLGNSLADSLAAVSTAVNAATTAANDSNSIANGDYALLAAGEVAAVPTGPVGPGAQV